MKIAFLIPRVEYSIPLGVAYCVAVLKERGFHCRVFEIGNNPDLTAEAIMDYRPAAIGASVYSGSHRQMIDFCARLKGRLDFIGIFGGPHATFFPGIIDSRGVDAVCRGEGELALAEFLEEYRDTGSIPGNVANFWVEKGGRILKNPVRPLLIDLDALPFPDRRLFVETFPIIGLHGIKHFAAHRGCPHSCTFCFNHVHNRLYSVNGRQCYRSRNPERVCEEINMERRRMRMDMVGFVDDCFSLDQTWTIEFCRCYQQEVNLPFQINTRVEYLDAQRIRALAAAGCRLIHVGVESGNEDYRKRVLKRSMTNHQLVETIKACRRAGIRILTENMIGLPEETYRQAMETVKLNIEASPDFAAVSYFTPYPGLALTRFAEERGIYVGGPDNFPVNYMHGTLLSFHSPAEKRRITNLRSFFNLGVQHPFLWPVIHFLVGLPPNFLFRILGDLADGYYLWKLLPARGSLKTFFLLARQYIVSYRKIINRHLTAGDRQLNRQSSVSYRSPTSSIRSGN